MRGRPESDEEHALRESIRALRSRLDAGEGGAPLADPKPDAAAKASGPAAEGAGAAGEAEPSSEAEPAGAAGEAGASGEAEGAAPAAENGAAGGEAAGAPETRGPGLEGGPGGPEEGSTKGSRTAEEELAALEAQLARLSAEIDDRMRFSRAGGRRDNW